MASEIITWSHYEPATGWTNGAALAGALASGVHDMVIDGQGNVFVGFSSSVGGVGR